MKREFIVTVIEKRRYRVSYFMNAASEAEARRRFEHGDAKCIGETAELLSIIDGTVESVKENK